ncbi:MAG: J domain-containing protein [Treponema sp.]
MENYYAILNVSPTASASEIKRAFRKKAKELHPDIPQNSTRHTTAQKNVQALKLLIKAYKGLLDEKHREESEFLYRGQQEKQPYCFNYREWLLAQTDIKNRVLLILFDLFHNFEDNAVQEFLRLRAGNSGFMLSDHFRREDFMDCGFVMAEELFFRNEYYESFLLLEQIISLEQQKPYFRHFFPEVLVLARKLIREKIIYTLADDLVLDCCESALNFGLSKFDKAEILKKMAEIYYRIGDIAKSRECIDEAYGLYPRLKGLSNIKTVCGRAKPVRKGEF